MSNAPVACLRLPAPDIIKYIADFCNVGDADIKGFLALVDAAKPSLITV